MTPFDFDLRAEFARLDAPLIAEFRFSKDLESDLIFALEAAEKRKDAPRIHAIRSLLTRRFDWKGTMTPATFGSSPDKRIAELLKAPLDLAPNDPPPPAPEPVADATTKAVRVRLGVPKGTPRPRHVQKRVLAQAGRRKRKPVGEDAPEGMGLLTTANLSVRRQMIPMPDLSPRPSEVQVVAGSAIAEAVQLPKREPVSMFCRVVPDHKRNRWFKTCAEPVLLFDAAECTFRVDESPRRGISVDAVKALATSWGARVA